MPRGVWALSAGGNFNDAYGSEPVICFRPVLRGIVGIAVLVLVFQGGCDGYKYEPEFEEAAPPGAVIQVDSTPELAATAGLGNVATEKESIDGALAVRSYPSEGAGGAAEGDYAGDDGARGFPGERPGGGDESPRRACEQIRGTEYRSEAEREYWLSECVLSETTGIRSTGGSSMWVPQDGAIAATHYRDLICSYSWPCGEAIAVWLCESGGNWGAYSQGNYGGFQINAVHIARVGGDLSRLFDPATNVAVAFAIWLDQGWGPWACRP